MMIKHPFYYMITDGCAIFLLKVSLLSVQLLFANMRGTGDDLERMPDWCASTSLTMLFQMTTMV